METKITFLGSASAFYDDVDNFQSNLLIERNDRKLLIDCGTDIRFSLRDAGFKMTDITDVYISHAHADHIGGLEGLGFIKKFTPGQERPNLFASSMITKDLWDKSLAGGMESIQGEVADLGSFFNVNKIKPNGKFTWEGIKFKLVQTIHIMNGFMFVPSFGLLFTVLHEGDSVDIFFTSDSQHAPNQIMDFYKRADIIFQDCETGFASGVHAHYSELVTLPEDVRSKMWLYHYNKDKKQDAVADGFRGFVECRQQFIFDGK